MRYFGDGLVLPFIAQHGYKRICEIGAHHGEATKKILQLPEISLTIIDPCVHEDLAKMFADNARVTIHRGLSLEVLPAMTESFDCFLIDGDHNWYTVFNELKVITECKLLAPGGTILLHDVRWPYARRDMYYDPETIPSEYIHAHAKQGIVRGRSELSVDSGHLRGLNNALHEGGPTNGVLTAVEDFLSETPKRFSFIVSPVEYGLGALIDMEDRPISRYINGWRLRFYAFAAKQRWLKSKYKMSQWLEKRFPHLYSRLKTLIS